MDEGYDNKLTLKTEDGSDISISVIDIVDSEEFDKTFIIYTLQDNNSNVFASILKETDLTYSLDTIVDNKEIDYVNELIRYFTEDDLEEEIVS